MSLFKKPIFWVGVAVVGIAAYALTDSPTIAKTNTPKFGKRSTKKTTDVFLPEDYKAQFASIKTEAKNSFQPLIVRKSGMNGDGAANIIPTDFTNGEAGWIYTGNAELDGSANALLENRTTGEGVFLRVGERWKSAVVSRILSDSVVMKGPSGTKTFSLINEESGRMARNGGFAPAGVTVPPGLSGTLGGNRNGQGRNGQGGPGGQFGQNFQNGQAFVSDPNGSAFGGGPGGGPVTIPADNGTLPAVTFAVPPPQ